MPIYRCAFEWIGPWLVTTVNGEPVRAYHRHDLFMSTGGSTPQPWETTSSGDVST